MTIPADVIERAASAISDAFYAGLTAGEMAKHALTAAGYPAMQARIARLETIIREVVHELDPMHPTPDDYLTWRDLRREAISARLRAEQARAEADALRKQVAELELKCAAHMQQGDIVLQRAFAEAGKARAQLRELVEAVKPLLDEIETDCIRDDSPERERHLVQRCRAALAKIDAQAAAGAQPGEG